MNWCLSISYAKKEEKKKNCQECNKFYRQDSKKFIPENCNFLLMMRFRFSRRRFFKECFEILLKFHRQKILPRYSVSSLSGRCNDRSEERRVGKECRSRW